MKRGMPPDSRISAIMEDEVTDTFVGRIGVKFDNLSRVIASCKVIAWPQTAMALL
jgi:hypothetical protein